LHMHIVPRWHGDTNFIPVTADTKVISFDIPEIYQLLCAGFGKI
jgi:ATP adenylyltransferase